MCRGGDLKNGSECWMGENLWQKFYFSIMFHLISRSLFLSSSYLLLCCWSRSGGPHTRGHQIVAVLGSGPNWHGTNADASAGGDDGMLHDAGWRLVGAWLVGWSLAVGWLELSASALLSVEFVDLLPDHLTPLIWNNGKCWNYSSSLKKAKENQ